METVSDKISMQVLVSRLYEINRIWSSRENAIRNYDPFPTNIINW